MIFGDIYRGRRVLVTGDTGFKGSWLTTWLLKLGADVTGMAKDVPTQPSMFEALGLAGRIRHIEADIRDLAAVQRLVADENPDFLFHLAAQAIVSRSYREPVETTATNVMGTVNILEALRGHEHPCRAVIITSDKCYENVEWVWGYRETDALGGKDIYSGSKAAAEILIRSYSRSFFVGGHPVRIAIGRAGNVIGGGDWARDRIVADCMRAWSEGHPVEIRSPISTRPWQLVLEPLSGYLTLGQALGGASDLHAEAFNFGPRSEQNRTVAELLTDLGRAWGWSRPDQAYRVRELGPFAEAGLLKLNCDKALVRLGWHPNLEYAETLAMIADWYSAYYRRRAEMYPVTIEQIASFEEKGAERGRVWAK